MRNSPIVRMVWKLAQSPALIFTIAVVIRLVAASRLLPGRAWDYFYDRNEAVHIAWALATGHGFSSPWPNTPLLPTAQQPPVYPGLLAVIFKIFGVYSYASLWIAISLNAVFAALVAVLLLRIGRQAFHALVGILAAWFWSCSLFEAATSDRLWESSLSSLLLVILFFLLLKIRESPKKLYGILFGLLAGIAALTNTSLLALFPFFWLWLWYSLRKPPGPCTRMLAVSVALCILVIGPWIARNYAVFHRWIPIRDNFGLELWVGNSYDTDFSILNVTEFNRQGEIPFMEAKGSRAFEVIKAQPAYFVRSMGSRAIRFWTAPRGSAWAGISLLAWAGLVLALWRKRSEAIPFAIVMIVFPIIYYITHSHVTYRYPIEPEILLLTSYVLIALTEATANTFKVGGAP